ncbi:hypothetical protein [Candidatus Enterococcus moelleringii]|nr:hypothetical protein [Enterococcus sp. 669A]
MKVAISNDVIAHSVKVELVTHLKKQEYRVLDLGSQRPENSGD